MQLHPLAKPTLWFASTLTVMAGATISPSIPQMTEVFADLPNASLLVGLLLTLPGLFIAVGSIVVGPVIDKRGRLPTFYIGLVLYAIGGTSGLYLDSIWMLLAGRALLGIAVAMIMTVAVTLAGDYFDGPAQKTFVGIQGVFMSIGGIVYVLVGGFLADVGWRAPFALYAASIVALVLAFRGLHEPDRSISRPQNKTSAPWTGVHVVLYGAAILAIVVFYTVPLQIPFLVKDLGIVENKYGGIAISLVMVGSATSGMFYRRLRARFAAPTLLCFNFLFMGLGYVLVPYASSYGVLLVFIFISGLAAGLLMPNMSNWILEISAVSIRGKAVGLLTSMIFLGQFLNPFVSNPMKASIGLTSTFQIIGFVSMGISLIFVIFHKPLRAPNPKPLMGKRAT